MTGSFLSTKVREEELEVLCQAVLQRYGIDFTCYEPKSLMRRVQRSLSVFRMDSINDLWKKCLQEQDFIHLLVNELTVGMTSLFRDPVLWNAIKNKVIPILSQKEKNAVWHAGCSTGEEVIAMGIINQKAGISHKINSLATDINQEFLKTAKKRKFHKLKIPEFKDNFAGIYPYSPLDEYYEERDKNIKFNKQLTENVSFKYHNLITENPIAKYDLVFCRNVMIYFDERAKKRLIDKIYNCLNPGGLFVIGFYDSLFPLIEKTHFTFFDRDAKIFCKPVEDIS